MKHKPDAKARKPQVKIGDMRPKKDVKGGLKISGIDGESMTKDHKG